jgi:hypothetical protein
MFFRSAIVLDGWNLEHENADTERQRKFIIESIIIIIKITITITITITTSISMTMTLTTGGSGGAGPA